MNANFNIHLEGQQIKVEIIDVPAEQTPGWLFCGHRIGAGVGVSSNTVAAIIRCQNKYAIVSVGSWIIYDILWDCILEARYKASIDSAGYIEAERWLIVYFYSFLPKELEDVHHGDYILAHGGGWINLRGVVDKMKTNRSEGQILQHPPSSRCVIDWN
jgi:hypothetical protein